MPHSCYTQNILVKNPNKVLKSLDLAIHNGKIEGFQISKSSSEQAFQQNDSSSNLNSLKKLHIYTAGFFNLHCHLTHTDITLNPQNLFPWLGQLVEIHATQTTDYTLSCSNGMREALSFGTTFLVDNTDRLTESISAYQKTGLRGVIGLEVFGSNPNYAEQAFTESIKKLHTAKTSLQKNPDGENSLDLQLTLSPHASYDVSAALWQKCSEWCDNNQQILLSHAAESLAEESWFRDKDSEQAYEAKAFWQKINTLESKLTNWQAHESSIDYLNKNKMLNVQRLLLTHMLHARRQDLELISKLNHELTSKLSSNHYQDLVGAAQQAPAQISLISCPRSNKYLNNGKADISLWEELKLPYGIGTDSKASNYDLDLRKEVKQLDISELRKLELLTTVPATIMGRSDLGSLEKGCLADFVVFEVDLEQVQKLLDKKQITQNQFNLALETMQSLASPPQSTSLNNTFDNEIENQYQCTTQEQANILKLLFDTDICHVKEVYIAGKKAYESPSL